MSFLQIEFYSDVLRIDCSMDVIYPQNTHRTPPELQSVIKPPYQVLYLLHGLQRNHSSWCRFTSIERYVMDMGLVVVMPTTQRGLYINQPNGYAWGEFIAEELPRIISGMFHISEKREDTFIGGLSMGGYGAVNIGLKYPEKYSNIISLSGGLDQEQIYNDNTLLLPSEKWMNYDGKNPVGGENDVFALAKKAAAEKKNLPRIFQAIGTDDFLYETNKKFYEENKDSLDITFLEEPGGHVWDFWDRNIERGLKWLPIKQRMEDYKQTFRV